MKSAIFVDFTEPLVNGAALPAHPALTTSRRIIAYGSIHDATTGTELHSGLHANEISRLMAGDQMALSHLYRYVVRDKKIYHTRRLVVIGVETEDVVD